jgi:hypothetical protein
MKKYDYIYEFINDFALVKLNDNWGFINEKGVEICSIKYDDVLDFENEYARVRLNDKWGVIETNGDEICKIKYDFNEIDYILEQYIKNQGRNLKLKQLIL